MLASPGLTPFIFPGRAGKTGCSITLIERRDRKQAQELIQILQEAGQDVPDELIEMAERYQRWKEREAEARSSGGGKSEYFGRLNIIQASKNICFEPSLI